MVKKLIYTIITIILISGIGIISISSANIIINQDVACEQPNKFTGKTIDTNPNKYCKTSCIPTATTKFPTKKSVLSVDQYDQILGGTHFNWEEILIDTEYDCTTNIDYNRWLNDYNRAVNNLKEFTLQVAREAHQYKTEEGPLGECELLINKNGNVGGMIDSALNINGMIDVDRYKYSAFDNWKNEYNEKLLNSGYSSNYASLFYIYNKGEQRANGNCWAPQVWGATSVSHDTFECNDDNYPILIKSASGGGVCVKSKSVADKLGKRPTDEAIENYCSTFSIPDISKYKTVKGQKYRYQKIVCGNTASSCYVAETRNYCSVSRPYWDVEQFDIYWKDVFRDAWNLINGSNGLISQLESCNNNYLKNIEKVNSPSVKVNYNEVTKNYMDASNLKLITNKFYGPEITDEKKISSTNKGSLSEIETVFDSIIYSDSYESAIESWDVSYLNKLYTENKTNKYNELQNTQIKSKIKTSYKYTMPDNIYRYIQKKDGKPVHRLTDDLKVGGVHSGAYIDLGKSTYPVHYQTPSGTYPISLTYNIPNIVKNNRIYPCEYSVKNKIIPGFDNPDIPNGGGGSDSGDEDFSNGVNIIYRVISLTNPFPGEKGLGRKPGDNWDASLINKYITKNRNVKANDVYNKTPLYSFTLTPKTIKSIKEYNKKHDYNDFELKCYGKNKDGRNNGTKCYSDFLNNYKNIINGSGTCYNRDKNDYYSCADKIDP